MISSNWCSIQDKLGSAAVTNNPELSVAQSNRGFFCSCSVPIDGKLQPLLHVIISIFTLEPSHCLECCWPQGREKRALESCFFFFFFWFGLFYTESLGRFLFLFFFWGGELFWPHPEAFVVFVQPGFRPTLPVLEGWSQPSNQQRSLWRVLNLGSFLATANCMAHSTWDRGQEMQWG